MPTDLCAVCKADIITIRVAAMFDCRPRRHAPNLPDNAQNIALAERLRRTTLRCQQSPRCRVCFGLRDGKTRQQMVDPGTMRQGYVSRSRICQQCRMPRGPIGTDLDLECIAASRPHLGASGPIRLEKQARRVQCSLLIQFQLMALSNMCQERGLRCNGQQVCRVITCVYAQPRH